MKLTSGPVYDAIRKSNAVKAIPQLICEWNWNRYADGVTVDNIIPESTNAFDPEAFPIEEIIKPNRPTAGVVKARVNAAVVAPKVPSATQTRFYVGSRNDYYKYWTSPVSTDSASTFPLHTDSLSVVRPLVTYDKAYNMNKIVVRFENSWTTPSTWRIEVSANGSTFTAITNPTINNATGEATLWYNGTTWVSTRPATPVATSVQAIRVRVDTLKNGYDKSGAIMTYQRNGVTTNTSGASQYCNIIEISGRYEADLTSRMISVSDTFDLGDSDFLKPQGQISANVANVVLSNDDGIFNTANTSSPYYRLIDANAQFSLSYNFTISGTTYNVPQFVMYANDWSQSSDGTVSVDLSDYAKFLQEIKPPALFYQDVFVEEAVWRVLESIGFVNYNVSISDTSFKIQHFFTSGEDTVWDVLSDIAEGTQTAIYFDGSGVLRVRSRSSAFSTTKPIDWTLRGEVSGTELADIEEFQVNDVVGSNAVTITYQATSFSDDQNGWPVMDTVWEPEDDVVLREAVLQKPLLATDTTNFYLKPSEALIWPYEAAIQVEGEIIRYSGKEYIYYTSNGTVQNKTFIKSDEEKETLDDTSGTLYAYKNSFSGAFAITARGEYNTPAKDHNIDISAWSVRDIINGTAHSPAAGFTFNKTESTVSLSATPKVKKESDLIVATHGNIADSQWYHVGTKMTIKKNQAHNHCGIVINSSSSEQGYYIELQPSAKFQTAADRKVRNELVVWSKIGSAWKVVATKAMAIVAGIAYTIDVTFKPGTQDIITVYINGVKKLDATTTAGTKQPAGTGRFGMFIKGKSIATYEYIYGLNVQQKDPPDDVSWIDRIKGGINTPNQLDREWIWGYYTGKKLVKKKWVKVQNAKLNSLLVDEFGPLVHEVREYDIKFDPNPVLHSRVLMSNDQQVILPDYNADAYGAKFVIANASRANAVVKGDDTLTYPGETVTHVFQVIGRALIRAEAASVVTENAASIRRRGRLEAEITSQWIQSKAMAQSLADWISAHWATGADTLAVTVYGNPLIELGDVVGVAYAYQNMTAATHQYFVVGVNSSFDQGLSTELTLRRRT